MLFSEPGLVALSIGAMVGNVFGLAVPDEVAKRELPVPLSCCAQHVPFRLRMKTNINDDDPMAEKNLNYYFNDTNPVYVAFSPDSKGEIDVPLTVGTENASIFELETFIPSDTTAQLYNKLRIVQYNLSSSGAWDKPWLRPSVTDGTDRVQGQGYHTLMISQFPEQATNFTTTLDSRLVYDDGHKTEPPFVVCYDDHHRRTIAMIIHRDRPQEAIPEVNGMICANIWLMAERLSQDQTAKVNQILGNAP